MDAQYELEVAKEGERSSSYSEDQWIAWEEKLALAPDLAAKRALVHSPFGMASPDFTYRTALCTLMEIQELLDSGAPEADAKANALLAKEREALLSAVRDLTGKSFSRKAKRIVHRSTVLELELATRLGKPTSTIQVLCSCSLCAVIETHVL
jgi:hypothetical protein